jgi:hypothetical protein
MSDAAISAVKETDIEVLKASHWGSRSSLEMRTEN